MPLLKKNEKKQEAMLDINKESLSYWFDKVTEWDSIKILSECMKAGADKDLALEITEKVEKELRKRVISSKQIKELVFSLLKIKRPESAKNFGTKNGLL